MVPPPVVPMEALLDAGNRNPVSLVEVEMDDGWHGCGAAAGLGVFSCLLVLDTSVWNPEGRRQRYRLVLAYRSCKGSNSEAVPRQLGSVCAVLRHEGACWRLFTCGLDCLIESAFLQPSCSFSGTCRENKLCAVHTLRSGALLVPSVGLCQWPHPPRGRGASGPPCPPLGRLGALGVAAAQAPGEGWGP